MVTPPIVRREVLIAWLLSVVALRRRALSRKPVMRHDVFDGRMGRGATSPPRAQSLGSAVARRANSGRGSREASLTRSWPDRLVIAITTARLESIREGACRSEERVAANDYECLRDG
jgi:hypothetical protein